MKEKTPAQNYAVTWPKGLIAMLIISMCLAVAALVISLISLLQPESIDQQTEANAVPTAQEMVSDEQSDDETTPVKTESTAMDTSLASVSVTSGNLVVSYDNQEKTNIDLPLGFLDEATIVASDDDYLYIDVKPDGLGGYILYGGYMLMYRVDMSDWSYIQMPIDGFMTDISTEHNTALLIERVGSQKVVSVMNLKTLNKLYIEIDGTYGQAGDALLSPGGTKVAYAATVSDPGNEYSVIYIYDMETDTYSEYQPYKQGIYHINSWIDNETLDYSLDQ